MISAIVLAFRQLDDPSVQRLLRRCVGLALATFAALAALVGVALWALDVTGIAWLDATLAVAGTGLALVVAWLLFPVAVLLTLNMFAEEAADAVERRHYPELPAPAGVSLRDALWGTAKLTTTGLLLNLLVLPLYFLPGPNLVVYLGLNGYLLGREYFELVAQRRLSPAQTERLRRALRGRVWLAGVMIALLLLVPLLNLIAPVLATAFMVHLFERWRRRMPVAVAGDLLAT